MGKSGSQTPANGRLSISVHVVMILASLWPGPARCQECRIQRCNTEYLASTSPPGGGLEEVEAMAAGRAGHCSALRAYSRCTRRTARSCRGDLVYHSAVFRIKELLSLSNCSAPSSSTPRPSTPPGPAPPGPSSPPGSSPSSPPGSSPSSPPGSSPSAPRPSPMSGPSPTLPGHCDYERRAHPAAGVDAAPPVEYALCALFGDPHLRTFGGELQTCRAEGSWPLLHNRYLSAQVTNAAVGPGSSATAAVKVTNAAVAPGSSATAAVKITLIFKAFAGCTEPKVYQATSEDLPSVFQDGTWSDGEGGASLWIAGRGGEGGTGRVRIEARYAGTSVIVRRVGRYLSFAVRAPEEVLATPPGASLQLCLHGCPLDQLIEDLAPPLPRPHPAPSLELAESHCREALPEEEEDAFFRSCVFDLLVTGDPRLSLAAFGALEDLRALSPSRPERGSSGTSRLHRGDVPRGTGVTPTSPLPLLALLLLLVLN